MIDDPNNKYVYQWWAVFNGGKYNPKSLKAVDDKQYWNMRWRRVTWLRKFVIWPRRCSLTDKYIWLQYAYIGQIMLTGPGDPVFLTEWHREDEHLIWLLVA